MPLWTVRQKATTGGDFKGGNEADVRAGGASTLQLHRVRYVTFVIEA